MGGSFLCAEDCHTGLELIQSNKIEAAFITRDLHANNDGVAEVLRTFCKGVFLTGTPDSLDFHSSDIPPNIQNEEVFHAFLPKPFRTDTTRRVLRTLRGKGLSILKPTGSPATSPLASPLVFPISNLRILVAEDNMVNRKVAIRLLERLGYLNVDMVENGVEVLKAMEAKSYDVILMDIQMPVMDGWTATEEIFKRYPPDARPEIIAMTAYAFEHDQQRCTELGMKAHIAKPVDVSILAETLRSCSIYK